MVTNQTSFTNPQSVFQTSGFVQSIAKDLLHSNLCIKRKDNGLRYVGIICACQTQGNHQVHCKAFFTNALLRINIGKTKCDYGEVIRDVNERKRKANMKVKTCTYHSSKSMSFCIISDDGQERKYSVESKLKQLKTLLETFAVDRITSLCILRRFKLMYKESPKAMQEMNQYRPNISGVYYFFAVK